MNTIHWDYYATLNAMALNLNQLPMQKPAVLNRFMEFPEILVSDFDHRRLARADEKKLKSRHMASSIRVATVRSHSLMTKVYLVPKFKKTRPNA